MTRTHALLAFMHLRPTTPFNLVELAEALACEARQARDAVANLQRKCCIAVELDHGIAWYTLTAMGHFRARNDTPKRPPARRGQPYEKRSTSIWDTRPDQRRTADETLQPLEVAARVPSFIFAWRP